MMTQEKTAEFFDRYAQDFSAIYGNDNTFFNAVVNKLFRQSMRERYQRTIEGCAPIAGRSVLDIGCGPGHYSLELARRGAGRVLGIDFADSMLKIAQEGARRDHVENVCKFERRDFVMSPLDEKFDYVIVMGFMDYIRDARGLIEKAMAVTKSKAFFSFPLDGGPIAWQRRMRYKVRCELFMYTEPQVRRLFDGIPNTRAELKSLGRDLFVTAHVT